MIYPQTILTVADNTGAKKVMCIQVLGGNKKYAEIGDTIIAVVKEAIPNMPIKRSDVVKAIIIRTKKTIRRQDGMYIRFAMWCILSMFSLQYVCIVFIFDSQLCVCSIYTCVCASR